MCVCSCELFAQDGAANLSSNSTRTRWKEQKQRYLMMLLIVQNALKLRQSEWHCIRSTLFSLLFQDQRMHPSYFENENYEIARIVFEWSDLKKNLRNNNGNFDLILGKSCFSWKWTKSNSQDRNAEQHFFLYFWVIKLQWMFVFNKDSCINFNNCKILCMPRRS